MGSACSSCSIVARSAVDNQYVVLYVPTAGYCVCCDKSAGLIKPADLYGVCYIGLLFDIIVSTSIIPFLQCPIMLYSLQAACTNSVPGGNVTILEDHVIGHSKEKTVHVHVSHSEPVQRKSYFTVQEFGFGAPNFPSLTLYCAFLNFLLWGWMNSEVYRTTVDTRDKLLELIMYVIGNIKKSRCTQTSNTPCPHISCKTHGC